MTPLRLHLLGMHPPVLSPSATHFCLQTPRSAEGQWPRCHLPVSAASVQVLGFAHGHIQGQEKPPLAPQHHCYRHPAEQSSAMCHHEWCVPVSGRFCLRAKAGKVHVVNRKSAKAVPTAARPSLTVPGLPGRNERVESQSATGDWTGACHTEACRRSHVTA